MPAQLCSIYTGAGVFLLQAGAMHGSDSTVQTETCMQISLD